MRYEFMNFHPIRFLQQTDPRVVSCTMRYNLGPIELISVEGIETPLAKGKLDVITSEL